MVWEGKDAIELGRTFNGTSQLKNLNDGPDTIRFDFNHNVSKHYFFEREGKFRGNVVHG